MLQTLSNIGGSSILLTERIQLKPSPQLSRLCHLTKNLYNAANYQIRQKFIKKGIWTQYKDLYDLLKFTELYQNLHAQTAQQVLRLLDQNWKSFFSAIQDSRSNPNKYTSLPRLPRYKPKNGQYKTALVGIKIDLVEESYTSRVSFLDEEPIKEHDRYLGKRIKRGLYKSSTGHILNADVNGGYNIARKAVSKAFTADGIEGVGLHPYSVTI